MAKLRSKASTLTDAQIDQLAGRLCSTQLNVYEVAKAMFNVRTDDTLFDRLEKVGRVFKCEECGFWLPITDKDRSIDNACATCVDVMDE